MNTCIMFLVNFNIQDVCSIRFLFFVLIVGVGGPASIKLGSSDGIFSSGSFFSAMALCWILEEVLFKLGSSCWQLGKDGVSWLNMFMGGLGSTEWYNPGGGFNVETAGMVYICIWYNMSQCSAIYVACVAWFWNPCRFWLGFCWFGAWMLILMFHCITDRCLLLWIKCALHAFGEKCCIRKIKIYWHRNGAKAGQAQHNLLEFGLTRMTLWMYAFQIVTIHRYSLYLTSTSTGQNPDLIHQIENLTDDGADFPQHFSHTEHRIGLPRCSMYGIFTYIWLKFMVNVGK